MWVEKQDLIVLIWMDRSRHRQASRKSRATSRLFGQISVIWGRGAGKDGALGGKLGEEVWAGVVGHWGDVRQESVS